MTYYPLPGSRKNKENGHKPYFFPMLSGSKSNRPVDFVNTLKVKLYGSLISTQNRRTKYHSVEAVMESCSLICIHCNWLDRLPELPAEIAGPVSVHGF